MLDLLFAIFTFGAIARLTRLVNTDTITAPIRAMVIQRWGPDSWQAEWVTCPWCVSIWVSLIWSPIAYVAWRIPETPFWYAIPATVLTYSYVYALMAQHLDS